MAKKDLEIVLITSDNTVKSNISGIVLDNSIKYNEDGVMVVLNINDKDISMIRTTDEYQLVLNFSEYQHKVGSYLLKENNMSKNELFKIAFDMLKYGKIKKEE